MHDFQMLDSGACELLAMWPPGCGRHPEGRRSIYLPWFHEKRNKKLYLIEPLACLALSALTGRGRSIIAA
jgi:hypothetical protein